MSGKPTIDEILDEALAIASETDREAYLLKSCGHAPDLLADVRSLIVAAGTVSILDRPLFETGAGLETILGELSPGQIGPYRILKTLGEGGMGSVFLAEQSHPVKRLVALKQIRFGRESDDAFLRFHREQHTLAKLEHPNIARVLDAAGLEGRNSYLVMEYIDGWSISDYCRNNSTTVSERLQLFLESCLAIQHAHQKAVIHRDIKPNNVMVTRIDGRPVVKVIDFGIAKILDNSEHEWEITQNFSGAGKSLSPGTPIYMSPEQLVGSQSQLDTRTDIYSLGALLYVLLTDQLPFDLPANNPESGELRRLISEMEPVRPSTRLARYASSSGAGRDKSVDARLLVALARARELQGDLDCIVMKAMSKEPARRYQTVGELMADVQNHLNHKPVTARPASVAYQLTRFAKRHRRSLVAVAAAIGCLVVGLIAALLQANRAARSERSALLSEQRMAERSYASDMLLASMAIQKQDSFEVTRKLERYLPQPGANDRRSFDWYLLNRINSFRSYTVAQLEDTVYFLCPLKLTPEVASCGEAGVIRIHHLETGVIRLKIATGQGEVNGLAVSPDGQLLASAGDDGTIRLWNLSNGEQTGMFRAHKRQAFQVAWSADGQWLATCGNEADVKLWSARDFALLETLSSDGKDLECVAVSAMGDVAFGAEHGAMTLIRPTFQEAALGHRLQQTGGKHGKGPAGHVSCVAFSPSGSLLVAGCEDGCVTFHSMLDDEPFFRELHFNDKIKSIAFSPDGQRLAVGKSDGLVTVIPLEAFLLNLELKISERLTDSEGNPATLSNSSVHGEPFLVRSKPALQNGRLPAGTNQVHLEFSEPLSAADSNDEDINDHYSLEIKQLSGNENFFRIIHPSNVVIRGKTVVLSFPEATLHTDREEHSQHLTGRTWKISDAHVASLCFSGDGSSLAVADENGHIWNLTNLEDSNVTEIATDVEDFAAADNGKMVILKNDYSSSLVDLGAGAENKLVDMIFANHQLKFLRYGFSNNGEHFYFLSGDDSDPEAVLLRWHGSAEKPEVVWKPAPQESLRHFLGCFESRWLVLETLPREQPRNAPGAKADIVVIDLENNREMSRVSGLVSVNRAISTDGRFLIRSTHDGVYFIDLRSGTVIATLPNSKPVAYGIAISADGSKVAISYSERTLRIYGTANAELLQEVKLQGGAISDLAWTSDGKTLVSISFDGFLRCWSSELLELTALLRLPTEDPDKLALSENGRSAIILDRSGRLYRVKAY